MDPVTKSFVTQYLELHDIESKKESTDFEKYSAYTILKKEYGSDLEFSIDDVVTNDDSKGLDAVAIILNEKIVVTTIQEIDDIIETSKSFTIDYIFIQSKIETGFSGPTFGNINRTIKDFFSENPQFVMTDKIKEAFELKKYLEYKYAQTKRSPNLKVFYVTLGKWTGDQNLVADLNISKSDLENLGYFNEVSFEPIDKQSLEKFDRKIRESVNASFSFEKQFDLPVIEGVENAFFGVVSFNDFRNLIVDDTGRIKNVFYDNVRDFLGDNEVNLKIKETLTDKEFDKFLILNNGVTVVAEEKKDLQGSKFTIFNYQIVNGCQTSHVLFNNKDIEGIENLKVPIRLIITKSEPIKSQITLATNRQSQITEEQLAAFSEFQKNLEQYYKSVQINNLQLYYERRTGQYNSDLDIKKTKIVNIKNQIKSVASMFLNKPHLVSGYYGKVYRSVEKEIFKRDDKLALYLISSYSLFRLEQLIQKEKIIDSKYNKARYHMLMVFRVLAAGYDVPKYFNSSEMEKYCDKLSALLNNDEETKYKFLEVCQVMDDSGINIDNQKLMYQENSRDKFLETAKNYLANLTNAS
jgi:hypothetical protein